jgi:hypothetical protein
MRWRIGVARVDAFGVRTCADAGDPQQSAIRAPAMRKAHEPFRSRIVQSVLLAGTADKVEFHPQDASAGRRVGHTDHMGPGARETVSCALYRLGVKIGWNAAGIATATVVVVERSRSFATGNAEHGG